MCIEREREREREIEATSLWQHIPDVMDHYRHRVPWSVGCKL